MWEFLFLLQTEKRIKWLFFFWLRHAADGIPTLFNPCSLILFFCLNQGLNPGPGSESLESQPLDHQGTTAKWLVKSIVMHFRDHSRRVLLGWGLPRSLFASWYEKWRRWAFKKTEIVKTMSVTHVQTRTFYLEWVLATALTRNVR